MGPEINTETAPDLGAIGREEAPVLTDEANSPTQPTDEAGVEVVDNTGAEQPTDDLKPLYTKATMELSDLKKRLEKNEQELSAYRQLYAQQNRQPQQPQQEQPVKDFNQMSEMEKFNYLVMQQMQPVLEPLQQEIAYLKQINNSLMAMEDKRIWNGFVEKNPDATEYREKIYEMVAKHKIDPDEAWALLNKDKLKDNVKQEVLKEFQVKKDASKLMKPVSTPSTPINDKVDSFEDAYKKALKELGSK